MPFTLCPIPGWKLELGWSRLRGEQRAFWALSQEELWRLARLEALGEVGNVCLGMYDWTRSRKKGNPWEFCFKYVFIDF